jgi:hypothetical protein
VPAPAPYDHGTVFVAPLYRTIGVRQQCPCGNALPPRSDDWCVFTGKFSVAICGACAAHYPEAAELAAKISALRLPREANPPAVVPSDSIQNDVCNYDKTKTVPTSRRPWDLAYFWSRGMARPELRSLGYAHEVWERLQPEINALLDGRTYVKPFAPLSPPPTADEVKAAKRAAIRHQIALSLVGIDDTRHKADPVANAERLLGAIEKLIAERVDAAIPAKPKRNK